MRLGDQAQARIGFAKILDDFHRVIRGTVVHDESFKIFKGLALERLKRLPDKFRSVERGNDNGDQWRLGRGHDNGETLQNARTGQAPNQKNCTTIYFEKFRRCPILGKI